MEIADTEFCGMLNFVVTAGKLRTFETDDIGDRAALDRAAARYSNAARDMLTKWARTVLPYPAEE